MTLLYQDQAHFERTKKRFYLNCSKEKKIAEWPFLIISIEFSSSENEKTLIVDMMPI